MSIDIVISNYDRKYTSTIRPSIYNLNENDYKTLDLTRIKVLLFDDEYNIYYSILTENTIKRIS